MGPNACRHFVTEKESSPILGYLFGRLLAPFWKLFATFWLHLGSNWALEACLIFYEFSLISKRCPQILVEQILEGKGWFGTPKPQNPDCRQVTSDLQSALTCEQEGKQTAEGNQDL